jgi:hypothetical protein
VGKYIYQITTKLVVKYTIWTKKYQNGHFPFQGYKNKTIIGIFGLKINHLASLGKSGSRMEHL